MSDTLVGCLVDKSKADLSVFSKPLKYKKISELFLSTERKKSVTQSDNKFIVTALIVSLAVALVGIALVSVIALSILRQLQRKLEVLELRVEFLEGREARFSRELDADESHENLYSLIHSTEEGTLDPSEASESAGRKKRTAQRTTRVPKRSRSSAPLASIHLEMVNGSRRRKRKNPNHILWRVSDWVPQQSRKCFKIEDSELAGIGVKHKGLYFIYAQVVFRNLGMNNIIAIKTKDREFTRCYDGVDHVGDSSEKLKTCYTGTVAMIQANDTIIVHNLYGHEIHTDSTSNFFGLIKLSDIP